MEDGSEHATDSMTQHGVEIVQDDFGFDVFVKLFADSLHLGHLLREFGAGQFEVGRRSVG